MTAALPPPLPLPALSRWQPLRVGLVELYHYDCEEFWFRDGHLLLRGNNGTGKSKVLSLTLPFLLDASLAAARVEPDGDRGKRMEWNLLMGRHERRTGYAWIEFGSLDEAGKPRYTTLGCGMAAVAGRSRVDSWHFVTDRRIGEDLHLVSTERLVLTRERLAQALGDRGQLYDTSREYRRAVDERLFRLGEERYAALIDTLITLRQPQLSKHPDEENLSSALTEALPPLPQPALEDVAEAMMQLDEYRDELASHQALLAAVVQFEKRYRAYAAVNTRREARHVRQAQTEYDGASRALNEANTAFDGASRSVEEHESRHAALQVALDRDQAALEELQRDPAMRDAHRLRAAEREAEERRANALRAEQRRRVVVERHARELAAAQSLRRELQESALRVSRELQESARLAAEAGMRADHEAFAAVLAPLDRLQSRTPEELEHAESGLRRGQARRARQVEQVRNLLQAVSSAANTRDVTARAREESAESTEVANEGAQAAARALAAAAEGHVREWAEYAATVKRLAVRVADDEWDELTAWTQSLQAEHPMRARLLAAQAAALQYLALREAAAKRQLEESRLLEGELLAEQARLQRGDDRAPPTPYTRDPRSRAAGTGAPFWHLVEFQEHVSAAHRAGLEAALEACGLLDAWVTPEGTLAGADSFDTVLVPRAARPSSLRSWLTAAPHTHVPSAHVDAILAAIECLPEDSGESEAWVSPDGRYRLGPAAGAWRKPAAEYIGHAAREAARRRRLGEIGRELASVESAIAGATAVLAEIEGQRVELDVEIRRAPTDTALRDAHATSSSADAARRDAQERLARAEARWNEAEEAWRRAQQTLHRDAEDLGLPITAAELQAVESRVSDYARVVAVLVQRARAHRAGLEALSRQEQREAEAGSDAEAALEEAAAHEREAGIAEARRDELRESIGAAVAEIHRRLAERDRAVREGRQRLREEGERRIGAREALARADQRRKDAQEALDAQRDRRQGAIGRLRAFALTGLLSVALPELELPTLEAEWTIDPALSLARRADQALLQVACEDADWSRVSAALTQDFTALTQAMSAQGHLAQAEPCAFGMVVHVVFQGRTERPDLLARRLEAEIATRREILTARERDVLENHLQAEIAADLQKLLLEAERRVQKINVELGRRPTSTGVRFKLEWQPLPEGDQGAPVGLSLARIRLLNTAADAWSPEDRRMVGEFLQRRIQVERSRDDGGSLTEHLARALDYRRWHRFRVKRFQDGAWRPLSGPASSGERALGLTVPLFAAASSHYASSEYAHAPRLVLLDEAFAGIDDEARAHCMGLIHEFDLDFVMTSEREWGCYAELPGLSICHLVRREGLDAVFVSRWSWDGKARREMPDPSRRFAERVEAAS